MGFTNGFRCCGMAAGRKFGRKHLPMWTWVRSRLRAIIEGHKRTPKASQALLPIVSAVLVWELTI